MVSYYNKVKKIDKKLFESNSKNLEYDNDKAEEIETLWDDTEDEIEDLLLNMLEEVYEMTSKYIRNIYGDNVEYPPSQIKFFDKDGKTLEERLDRWFNPYQNQQLNLDFIKNTTSAVTKANQISMTEALNQMEIVKFDKLFGICDRFTIDNEDEDDDCGHSPACDQYWREIYRPNDDGTSPIPPPPYHPDCECYAVYYLDHSKLEQQTEELEDSEEIEE